MTFDITDFINDRMFEVVAEGSLFHIKKLMSQGASIHIKDDNNASLIFYCKDEKTLDFLIKHGLDIDHIDLMKRPALYYACIFYDLDKIDWLLKRGANLEYMDSYIDNYHRTKKYRNIHSLTWENFWFHEEITEILIEEKSRRLKNDIQKELGIQPTETKKRKM